MSGISCKSVVELVQNEGFRQLKIAEINACGVLHSYLKDHPNVYYSEWLPEVKPGEVHDGVRCEDLQCLTYPGNYFDIILTSETLEHVPDPDRAWREIWRTLKGDGYHLFTIPVVPSQKQTIQRIRFVEGVRQDLLEPAYHGSPERQDMLVYTDFGMDVTEKLATLGLRTESFYLNSETELDVSVVFRSRKMTEEPKKNGARKVITGLEWTGERYLPWLEDAAIGYEHLHRYAYATQFVHNKIVLDLACGEGYGSYLLARNAKSVVGIDIDEITIKHARNKYIKQNLAFKVGSITEVPVDGARLFDIAVCFEALEHIEDHHKLITEVKRLLTPDGVFVVSTPNKSVYTDEPQYNNPFHVHELYFDEFRELLQTYFKSVKFLGQRIYSNSNIWPVFPGANNKVVEYVIDRNPREFVFVENDRRIPLYFIAIASDSDHNIEDTTSALIDISDCLLNQKDEQIAAQGSERERLGKEVERLQLTAESKEQVFVQKETRLTDEIVQLQTTVRCQQEVLAEKEKEWDRLLNQKDEQIAAQASERERLSREIAQLQTTVRSQEGVLADKEKEVTELVSERERASHQAIQLQATLQTREQYIMAIEDSLAWSLLVKYRTLRDKLCTEGTRRRKIYDAAKNVCKNFVQRRMVALQPDYVDPSRSAKNRQSISVPVDSPVSAFQTTAAKSILAPMEELILAKLSVVIPTKNGMSEGFDDTLSAISRQRGIAETEIIVVDSGSSDGTVEAAKSYGVRVFTIPAEEFNHGMTRNYAADQTTGDLVMFTVQDAIPASEDLFYEMAKTLLADPELAGVSVRQLPKSDADIYACWERWNHNRFYLENSDEASARPHKILDLPPEQLLRLAGLDNVCSMVKKNIWEKIRFKPTEYAEDLEFGLSCLREGYKIRWLSHRSTVHSHTRQPFYYMSRHYVDRRVMHELLKDRSPEWIDSITPDQLFSSVKATYAAINEFVQALESSSMHDPRRVLRELVSYVSARCTQTSENDAQFGEASLSKFFVALESCFSSDLPRINPCIQNYEGTIHSILEFIGDRYPRLSGLELSSIIYKAYAGVAGSVFGSFCFGGTQGKFSSSKFKCLDDSLAKGYRE
jgi:2-polyprenyl-3-methyl-5-hydroxy-6-metoxy-1,4-benzoquinol methylase/glycosyltransferase involved in cell wall biosynthesis